MITLFFESLLILIGLSKNDSELKSVSMKNNIPRCWGHQVQKVDNEAKFFIIFFWGNPIYPIRFDVDILNLMASAVRGEE